MGEDDLDKYQEIYVRTGTHSDLAAEKLAEKGFTKVYNVLPGISSWNGDLSKKLKRKLEEFYYV